VTEADSLDSSLDWADRNSPECWPRRELGSLAQTMRLATKALYHPSLLCPGPWDH